jgi:two-component system chemotaxis response regulator CheB
MAKFFCSDPKAVNPLDGHISFSCPKCGGVLWKMSKDCASPFRCRTGHAYTTSVLLTEHTKKVEETMWAALRMFEERENLMMIFSAKESKGSAKRLALEKASFSAVHINRIKELLKSDDNGTITDIPI